jgi:hypothetical protein
MKYNLNGEPIKYNLNKSQLDEVLKKKFNARQISLEEAWVIHPCCSIDSNGKEVDLLPEEKTVSLLTEEEISTDNIACYVIDDQKILKTQFRNDNVIQPENIFMVFEFDKDLNILLDYYCHTSFYGGVFDYIASKRIS